MIMPEQSLVSCYLMCMNGTML
uniref:Uncharacterized protein n=1 Tax=Anguilla anguilla TaxID=7936 RepID=A0A0E9TJ75_ANGAN